MEYSELGRSGIKVSRLCLGTMTFGQQNSEAEGHAQMDYAFARGINIFASNVYTIAESVAAADLVVGAVLIPGASAPKLITREMLVDMAPNSVIVDVAVDQGGCIETTHATTHSDPTYFVEGVLHYCVANMPGAVPRTSTFGLTNATLPFALQLANRGFVGAVRANHHLAEGVNTYKGKITYEAVATSQGHEYTPLEKLL